MLAQYDEVLDGPKKKIVVIGDSGEVEGSNDQEGNTIRGGAISLHVDKMQEIREFYTEQELVKFNKVKTVSKITKQK